MLDPNLLRTLATVVELGTFSRAQRELRLTQPALSKRIKALEGALGQPVLVRSTPLRATAIGKQLIAHYRHLEVMENALLARIGSETDETHWPRLPLALN